MKSEKNEEKTDFFKVYFKESGLDCVLTARALRQNYKMMLIRGPT